MKKNVAGQKIGAQLVSATDGSAFTGSVTVAVTVDAGTQATGSVGSGACTHEGGGYHTYAPSQAETNGDLVAFTFSGTGAVPVTIQIYTRPTTGLLAPTVDGRTLDVSAGGEAGIDWANVGSPTTVLNLSGTAIKTATDVETDTADIQTRLPAALVSGRMDASVGAMATGVLTASAIAADAITDAKVASDVTIASVTGAVGSVTGNVGGNVVGSVGSVSAAVNVTGDFSPTMKSSITSAVPTTSQIAAAVDVALINTGDGADLLQAIANQIAADWVAGDASPLAVVAALMANSTFIQLVADATAARSAAESANTKLGTAGAGLTNIPWNAAWDAEVQSECADALAAYDPPTNAEMEARTIAAASYATATELAKVIKSGESRTIARTGQASITFTETRP